MPPTQDSHTTFKPNLTCIFLSARARYIITNPDEIPCSQNCKLELELSMGIHYSTILEATLYQRVLKELLELSGELWTNVSNIKY